MEKHLVSFEKQPLLMMTLFVLPYVYSIENRFDSRCKMYYRLNGTGAMECRCKFMENHHPMVSIETEEKWERWKFFYPIMNAKKYFCRGGLFEVARGRPLGSCFLALGSLNETGCFNPNSLIKRFFKNFRLRFIFDVFGRVYSHLDFHRNLNEILKNTSSIGKIVRLSFIRSKLMDKDLVGLIDEKKNKSINKGSKIGNEYEREKIAELLIRIKKTLRKVVIVAVCLFKYDNRMKWGKKTFQDGKSLKKTCKKLRNVMLKNFIYNINILFFKIHAESLFFSIEKKLQKEIVMAVSHH